VRVSTAEFEPHERFSYWSEVISRTYARAEAHQVGEEPFQGKVSTGDLGGIGLTNIGSQPMRYNRERKALAADGCDHFFVGFTVSGRAAVDQDGRLSNQQPGEIVVYNAGKPYINHFPELYNQVVLIVPRSQIVSRLPDVDRLTSTTLRCETPVGRIARKMFEELGSYEDTLPANVASQLGASVLDVLTLAMKIELLGDELSEGRGAERLGRIKRYLLNHLEAPSLTIEKIAADNAVSVRTLHRLFAANGEAVQHWLYEQRLHAGYRALAEGKISQVTEAAITYGFADASHFAKAFKKSFGLQPSALLRKTVLGAPDTTVRSELGL
jgi:AraC family transcriptional activator of tynA and feaB